MRFILAGLLLLSSLSVASLSVASACGSDSDCMIGERTYRIRMPDGHDGKTPVGAIMFMHGYKGSAAGTMRNKALEEAANKLGVALIGAKSKGNDWEIPGVPDNVEATSANELAYFEAMVEDATNRFPIDRNRLMAAGFSAGSMMVWTLACERGTLFSGYLAMSGTFWAPMPQSCPSKPVNFTHVHGTKDPVVPLSGRAIAQTHQGDVETAIALFVKQGQFEAIEPVKVQDLSCRRWQNTDRKNLEFCLHPGGHRFKASYLTRAWQRLEKAQTH